MEATAVGLDSTRDAMKRKVLLPSAAECLLVLFFGLLYKKFHQDLFFLIAARKCV